MPAVALRSLPIAGREGLSVRCRVRQGPVEPLCVVVRPGAGSGGGAVGEWDLQWDDLAGITWDDSTAVAWDAPIAPGDGVAQWNDYTAVVWTDDTDLLWTETGPAWDNGAPFVYDNASTVPWGV